MKRNRVAGLTLAVALLATGLVACDQGHEITYENETAYNLIIYRFGHEDFGIGPNETKEHTVLEFSPNSMPVEARNEEGTVIYSDSFTWDELKAADWKIVITEKAVPAEPTATP